ncbi:hypothetical protein BFS14_23880 [Serratia fonticola]|nr:hypothetical protein BFS14_23880 [Serratia fonticola]
MILKLSYFLAIVNTDDIYQAIIIHIAYPLIYERGKKKASMGKLINPRSATPRGGKYVAQPIFKSIFFLLFFCKIAKRIF